MGNRTKSFDRDYTPAWAVEGSFVSSSGSVVETAACCYCGELAFEREHLVPYKWLKILVTPHELHVGDYWTWILPSCNECNMLAFDQVFSSAHEKRWYIQSRLRARYDTILNQEPWVEEELDDLGPNLHQFVSASQAKADTVRLRVSYAGPLPEDLGSESLTTRVRATIRKSDSTLEAAHA
jgi:hypothetical protein